MKKRYYKDIETVTFDFIYGDSPVELIDRTACYDIETFKYYLKVRLRNVSGREISQVQVRVDLYDGISILPYKKLDHVYRIKRKKKEDTDIIGDNDYIPIPESYYKSLDINIISVTFEKGETVELGLSSMKKAKRISDQPNHIITACELVDDSEHLRDTFPAIVMPEFGQTAWICSCSHKNPADAPECERCTRSRDDLKELYTVENLEKVAHEEAHGTLTMTARRVKSEFMERRDAKPIDEKKELLIEEQKEKVEKREKFKEKMRIQALPRIALYFVLAYLLYFILNWLFGLVPN